MLTESVILPNFLEHAFQQKYEIILNWNYGKRAKTIL
jgi:hypothetical protein